MHFDFSRFDDPPLDAAYVRQLLETEHLDRVLALRRLWSYYRNELDGLAGGAVTNVQSDWAEVVRPYRQEQEFGLPARITGAGRLAGATAAADGEALRRKEVVIENDIGWRIDTGVHFLFGKPPVVESLAADPERARRIESVLAAVLEANGGVALLQEAALTGSVYGFADLLVRLPRGMVRSGDRWVEFRGDRPVEVDPLRRVTIEVVDAPRAVPVLAEDDYRRVDYYVLHYAKPLNRLGGSGPTAPAGRQATVLATEVLGRDLWQYYEDGRLVEEGENLLGRLPLVHVQNLPVPGRYEGASDVEPLIPLQDELNTRLSDRAGRVTFQSFKMYLGRGIEDFASRPVAPGRMWSTDNPDASIEEFGGDADSPSEAAHVAELREAMDKVSGITPLAAGLLRDRVGNLTSAAALRVTLMGTLSRVERKRVTYGEGLARLNRLVLKLLDRAGIFSTDPDERGTRLHWPSPLPENQRERLDEARAKIDLGIPRDEVLRELGYPQTKETDR